jgi:hypothetical protein
METDEKKKELLEALAKCYGIVTNACKKVGIARATYYCWKTKDKEFADGVQEVMEAQIDFVESKLLQLINEGDTTATIFYLKTRGRDRGFGNKLVKDEARKDEAKTGAAVVTQTVKADEAKADEARDFKKAVEAKQRYLVKLLKDQGKYTSELSMQAKVVAQLLVRTDYLAEQVFSPLHKPVSVEVSREGNSREKVSEIETLYLKYSDQAQRALKALGMNTDSKERKTDEGSDSFTEFMKKMNDE